MNHLSDQYAQYTATKAAWIAANPGAAAAQIEHAARVIARRLGL